MPTRQGQSVWRPKMLFSKTTKTPKTARRQSRAPRDRQDGKGDTSGGGGVCAPGGRFCPLSALPPLPSTSPPRLTPSPPSPLISLCSAWKSTPPLAGCRRTSTSPRMTRSWLLFEWIVRYGGGWCCGLAAAVGGRQAASPPRCLLWRPRTPS